MQLFKPELKKKKVRRRMENELEKTHGCPYSACKKEYASSLALNLHIRNKHNGGTKKDRIAYIVPSPPLRKKCLTPRRKGAPCPLPSSTSPPRSSRYTPSHPVLDEALPLEARKRRRLGQSLAGLFRG
jgi:hypothetical protein